MSDPPKHDGEINLKRERRRASAAGAHDGTPAEPDRQEPERNRPVLHLRKKNGVDAPLKKP